MKILLMTLKLFIFVTLFFEQTLGAQGVSETQPTFDKVYRTDRVGDAYQFLLLTKDGLYYHLQTNRTDTLTPDELKSPNILNILKQKQSWGQSFPKKGNYTIKEGKIFTELLWDRINVVSSKNIKYLNKSFSLKE